MSLNLDARQRAMLLEMGVRVWQPQPSVPELMPVPDQDEGLAHLPTARTALPHAAAQAALAQTVSAPSTAPTTSATPVTSAPAAQPPSAPHVQRAMPSSPVSELDWAGLQAAVTGCQACGLCATRQHAVFGTGGAQARWLVVGEAPGEQEDLQGQPFVGPAGKLLDNMLSAVGLSRSSPEVFITNALKCRPPANRNPQPEEMAQCAPYLRRQIELIQPNVILALGRFAAQSLLQDSLPEVVTTPLGKLRGQLHSYHHNVTIPVVVSYHPAYLLRAPADKAKAWADLCLALATAPVAAST